MDNNLVSIIMPVYNVQKYISLAIESVLRQDYKNWELLVIDDGSPDNSIAIANDFARKDNRIKILHKTNGGLSDARNCGLERAQGNYIHFFDSDDFISPDFYTTMLSAFNPSVDIVICGYYKEIETDAGCVINRFECINLYSKQIDPNKSYRDLFVSYFNYAWNKVFKREFLIQNELKYQKGLSIIEDKEFMTRAMVLKPNFKFINYLGYHYQVRKRNTLNNTVTNDFVDCNIKGILLQNIILAFYCENKRILNPDIGYTTFMGVSWTIHCVFNSNNKITLKKRKALVSKLLHDDEIQKNLTFFIPRCFKERVIKSLYSKKLCYIVSILYLPKIVNI